LRPSVREDKLAGRKITTGGAQTARERPFMDEEREPQPLWRRVFGG